MQVNQINSRKLPNSRWGEVSRGGVYWKPLESASGKRISIARLSKNSLIRPEPCENALNPEAHNPHTFVRAMFVEGSQDV